MTEWKTFQIRHPFTCIVSGPSGCGKSTFVSNLLDPAHNLLSFTSFDYVYVFLGTQKSSRSLLTQLPGGATVFELPALYGDPLNLAKSTFPSDFKRLISDNAKRGLKGMVIFDDLMAEMSETSLLVSLFTKMSSHNSLSVIYITQNLFFQGKSAHSNGTLMRNVHVCVVFDCPQDLSVITNLAARQALPEDRPKLRKMLNETCKSDRYVVIRYDIPSRMKYSTNWFSTNNVTLLNLL